MEKKNLVRKGMWTPEEDILLRKCIENFGEGKWHLVSLRAGLNRCRKSCRLRWLNYLKPNIRRGQFSKDEVDLIIRLHKLLGNRWSLIAGRLPGRTANDVKNFWNSHIEKKVARTLNPGRVKPITQSNILRPQPRTFSDISSCRRLQDTSSGTCQPNIAIVDSKKNNHIHLPSSSHEGDECIRWWTNLLLMSTKNELQNVDGDHKLPDHISERRDDCHQNPNPQGQGDDIDDGIDDFCIGFENF